jgi:hypothetical protein
LFQFLRPELRKAYEFDFSAPRLGFDEEILEPELIEQIRSDHTLQVCWELRFFFFFLLFLMIS